MKPDSRIEAAAGDIADGLTDLLAWAHEPGGRLRDQHVIQGRDVLARGLAEALTALRAALEEK